MPRPRKQRCVNGEPRSFYFKPRAVPMTELQECVLRLEEFEALRLADAEGLNAEAAALVMAVSRHTFGRMLRSARHTVALALVHGCALRIEGRQE